MLNVALVFLVLILFILLGFPIFMATIITSVVFIFALDIPFSVVIIKLFGSIDSFALMAIPFFIFAGNVMMEAKITDRIVSFSNSIVGQFKGGLAHVNIAASIFFAGIQGSGAADASAIGSVMIPSMTKQGYDADYAVAVTASSSMIGPIIPPSIAMIMYSYYTELSVAKLFLGGLLPGLIIGLGLMVVNAIYYRIRKYDIPTPKFSFRNFLHEFKRSIGALIMPLIIIVGIVAGVFTPTESGIAAALYGLVYGFFISKKLTLKKLPKIIMDSAATTAMVMITIAAAGVLSNVLVRLNFQNEIINLAVNTFGNPYIASLFLMLVLLILGLFLDPTVLIAMFATAMLAAGTALGFEPIHFGVLMVITMQLGAITPPVGTFLFISCSIANISLEKSTKALMPFFLVEIIVTISILFLPWLATGVTNLIF
ncbi:MAG: TRAP transporter large permease [Spirochaetae bacterium HGW-Spirochaetae-4]|jgi:C4-dicarboxylate transporter DctM subunit|nr:MAG: TRAP transporter large permease [Spirochaetae bacterium HGW-Spirochaetae-4]HCS35714.1 TRAP transporter large permease [Sphaerochaeta sp.]